MNQLPQNKLDQSALAKKAIKWILVALVWGGVWWLIISRAQIDASGTTYKILIAIAVAPLFILFLWGGWIARLSSGAGYTYPVKSLDEYKLVPDVATTQLISRNHYVNATKEFSGWWIFLIILFLLVALIFGMTPYAWVSKYFVIGAIGIVVMVIVKLNLTKAPSVFSIGQEFSMFVGQTVSNSDLFISLVSLNGPNSGFVEGSTVTIKVNYVQNDNQNNIAEQQIDLGYKQSVKIGSYTIQTMGNEKRYPKFLVQTN